jgi:hypothetical protein
MFRRSAGRLPHARVLSTHTRGSKGNVGGKETDQDFFIEICLGMRVSYHDHS